MRRRTVLIATIVALAAVGTGVARGFSSGSDRLGGFTPRVTNPWFPLKPGTTYIYRGIKDDQPLRDVVTVTHRTKMIDGALCAVVEDRGYLGGRLRERTADWYTQDAKETVWYFGEATAELDRKGRVTSTEGSWQAGRDGTKAGIFMPAHPKAGQSFLQEFYKGHAEDRFRVLTLHATVKVPFTSSQNALLTKEWTALEPGVIGHKFYVRGIGLVLEQEHGGGVERAQLVAVRTGG